MPLSWNEIRNRAFTFAKEWQNETSEHAEAKSFWDDFFNVFGVTRRRVAAFEKHVKKVDGKDGFIDLLWKGTLLIEHKSKGKNLDRAHQQATDYFSGLKEKELPKYILVSDFDRFRLYDLDQSGDIVAEFHITDLPSQIKLFAFMAGYTATEVKPEDPVNIKAAEKMGRLHDKLESIGYTGHNLEIYLVRLLFCLFAEDTGIFEKNLFRDFIQIHTKEDGSDLAAQLNHLFQVLNTPQDKRLSNLAEQLSAFEYINGNLFADFLPVASFDSSMRTMLFDACDLDWGSISPAIFGSLFQSVMNVEERRNLGAHYTSESNILKLINPLFLDDLRAEFHQIRKSKKKLVAFHKKLAELTFLDPACGCGNFLIITYRELRLLELEVLKALHPAGQGVIDIRMLLRLNVDQFYGIEHEEFPAQIAQVAMWLVDHQMNLMVSEAFGIYFARLPLVTSATIIHGNALTIAWEDIIAKETLSYILGNPPFYGYSLQTKTQKEDMKNIFSNVKGSGVLDYVAAWYHKAAIYIQGTKTKVAFVSTNSITQGEQAGILWQNLIEELGIKIHFAHRTFRWNNEAKGNAAVHVVIIGFAVFDSKNKSIFNYENVDGKPHKTQAGHINLYLLNSPSIFILKRRKPICRVPEMVKGNQPTDGGNLLLLEKDRDELLAESPQCAELIRPFLGAREFLNNKKKYCLWLIKSSPSLLKQCPMVMKRIEKVKEMRSKSKKAATRKWADYPMLFSENRQPRNDYSQFQMSSYFSCAS